MKLYILSFLLLFTILSSFLILKRHSDSTTKDTDAANIVFKSTDGGQTWQDISKGLPKNLLKDGLRGDSILANNNGLFLQVGKEVYHSLPDATGSFWTKQASDEENNSNKDLSSGLYASTHWSVNLQTRNGLSIWSPIYENQEGAGTRITFETARGAVFIGLADGIIKSDDNGKSWKHVYRGGLIGHLAESEGVLLATSMRKIIRSTDNGETWAEAISEDAVAWDIKPINGGFVAITSESESGKRRLSTSYDGGMTWQSVHSRLQDKAVLDSIGRTWNDRPVLKTFQASISVGEDLFSIHRLGIFKSSDKGKTWKLLLPSVDDKLFNLFGSGKVLYAIRSRGGC